MSNENARNRRENKTTSEGLLWSILRGQQLCGLKFRREHPIGPWIADFACVSKTIVIEIDGGYHEVTSDHDLYRQRDLEFRGWRVLRFAAEDVEADAEQIASVIATTLGLEYAFYPRKKTGAGKESCFAKKPKPK